ncbi:stress-related protein-like [Elaeis guineensis]|uniref:stress-related protein-like n=1 Tax=Elaeis guineensis var. tenera TaxID=51953 RepID=UPI003C6D07EE
MAESIHKSDEISQEGGGPKLKYLDFVHVAAIQAVVSLASVYDFAKENSGPLNPGIQTVVGTVKTVIGPVYDKFHDVPLEFLKFVDRKASCMRLSSMAWRLMVGGFLFPLIDNFPHNYSTWMLDILLPSFLWHIAQLQVYKDQFYMHLFFVFAWIRNII